MASRSSRTPLMQQYHAAKQKYPECLLFFRLGDFFELFYEDAVVAARDMQIALTSRSKEKGEPVPMCGVPGAHGRQLLGQAARKGPPRRDLRSGRRRPESEGAGQAGDRARSLARNDERPRPAQVGREQLPRRRAQEQRPQRTGLSRRFDGRVPHDRNGVRTGRRNAMHAERQRGADSVSRPVVRPPGRTYRKRTRLPQHGAR